MALAIGAPLAFGGAGAVTVERGGATDLFRQGDGTVGGSRENGDRFGAALGAKDLNGDGWDELVIGVPREDLSGQADAGVFHILWSKSGGSGFGTAPFYSQSIGNGAIEAGDRFGSAIAVGVIGTGGNAGVAVSAPLEDNGPIDAGTVGVFRRTSGTTMTGGFLFQGTGSVAETKEPNDHFGASLSVGRFDLAAYEDLVVGVPNEALNGVPAAGLVHVLYGGGTGVDGTKENVWTQNKPGVADTVEKGDGFGTAVR
jgi:hypothetical protein